MAETLLLRNADLALHHAACRGMTGRAGDDVGQEIRGGGLFARDGVIEAVGVGDELPDDADIVLHIQGHVVTPGMVNTHHHLFQNLTRGVLAAQNAPLFGWLQTLYPIWSHIGPDHIYWSTALGLAELALSGCTTSSDHLYLYPNGARLDDALGAAADVGVRFHGTRGSMSIGESAGVCHQTSYARQKPTSWPTADASSRHITTPTDMRCSALHWLPVHPSVSMDLMRETARMARSYGVGMHTHLAENSEDIDYSLATYGMRPGDYIEAVEWTGDDVWHAHCVQLDADEIQLFARTGTGVAHCPCSNMRLASGIAPVRAMLDAGMKVGLGVDGSASNDSGHMLNEARQAMLLQRVNQVALVMSAREALATATRGGAALLGRNDIGMLGPGMAADIACFDRRSVDFAGSDWDMLASLLFCGPTKANYTIINGRIVVAEGQLASMDSEQAKPTSTIAEWRMI